MFIVPVTRDARQFSRFIDDTVERLFNPGNTTHDGVSTRNPALDVSESDTAYTVELDMPGVNKEDVKVSVEGRVVSVQAQGAARAELPEGERLVYRERTQVRYARRFTLANEIDQGSAQARLENGVLTLTLPKRGARAAAQLTVN